MRRTDIFHKSDADEEEYIPVTRMRSRFSDQEPEPEEVCGCCGYEYYEVVRGLGLLIPIESYESIEERDLLAPFGFPTMLLYETCEKCGYTSINMNIPTAVPPSFFAREEYQTCDGLIFPFQKLKAVRPFSGAQHYTGIYQAASTALRENRLHSSLYLFLQLIRVLENDLRQERKEGHSREGDSDKVVKLLHSILKRLYKRVCPLASMLYDASKAPEYALCKADLSRKQHFFEEACSIASSLGFITDNGRYRRLRRFLIKKSKARDAFCYDLEDVQDDIVTKARKKYERRHMIFRLY